MFRLQGLGEDGCMLAAFITAVLLLLLLLLYPETKVALYSFQARFPCEICALSSKCDGWAMSDGA